MNNQGLFLRLPLMPARDQASIDPTGLPHEERPAKEHFRLLKLFPPLWFDRLLAGGMILSLALYCIVGNTHLGTGAIFHVAPLLTLPFLLVFLVLCWYRLPFAVALLPLSLPFYLWQKTVVGHYSFSAAEIALWSCVAVALLQVAIRGHRWPYWLSWVELRARLGIFLVPMLLFLLAAAWSVLIAYNRTLALRAFREEVLDPLLYLLLILYCLRTRRDLVRLLLALFGAAFVIALIGLVQYADFLAQARGAVTEPRINAVYGSANSVGLFFDYALPVGLALILLPRAPRQRVAAVWGLRLLALLCCLPLLVVLYLTYSGGAWGATICALLFLIACALGNPRVVQIGGLALLLLALLALLVFHARITNYLLDYHANAQGISTFTKRIYLWESAWRMIRDNPITSYGLDNWLCHYSLNPVCNTPHLYHYWITSDPHTHQPTGLRDEPDLSHPHNILLQVWVSIGIFGLLAFIALAVLFFWLFFRMLRQLRPQAGGEQDPLLFCMTLGVGSGMVAALVQGMVDSSFLEQDLAFCFWILVASLLLLRLLSKTPWRGALSPGAPAANVG